MSRYVDQVRACTKKSKADILLDFHVMAQAYDSCESTKDYYSRRVTELEKELELIKKYGVKAAGSD